jgi:hypothetical protein
MANCRNPARCPDCVDGSNYLPADRRIKHPAKIRREEEKLAARRAWRSSASFKRGKDNNRQGKRAEREVAKSTGGKVIPLSGNLGGNLSGDVILPNGMRVEVKGRADGSGFALLHRWLEQGDKKPDALILRADRQKDLLVVEMEKAKAWGWLAE